MELDSVKTEFLLKSPEGGDHMKKFLSILLTLTMILSVFSVLPVAAQTQADDNTVSDTQTPIDEENGLYIKADGVYYEAEKGQIFTYQHIVSIDLARKIAGADGNVYYDTQGLDLVPYYDEYGDEDVVKHFPRAKYDVVYNFGIDGQVIYTFSNINGIRYGENAVMFACQFEVTADSGVYEIDGVLRTLADVDRVALVHEYVKYDDFGEEEIITGLDVCQDMTEENEEPIEDNKKVVYFVDSLRWYDGVSYHAHAFTGTWGTEGYVENKSSPGQPMPKTTMKSPDGASVYKVYIYGDYENISFSNAYSYTEVTDFRPSQFYDNATNKWYETLSDVPAYTPSATETQPTQKPTTKPDNDNIDGLYIKTDGVYYKAEKGQKFTYEYRISVDSARKVSGFVTEMYYDTQGLDFEPYYDEAGDIYYDKHFPKIPGGLVYNFAIDGKIYYNYAHLRGVTLDNNSVVFTGQFEVTADSGVYEINTVMTSLGDTDLATIISNSVKYDEFADCEIITDLDICDDMTDTPVVEPTQEQITIYYVDSVKLNSDVPVFAHAYKGEQGSADYIENAKSPGQYMVSIAQKSPDGVMVRMVYLDAGFDTVRFQYASKPMTDEIAIEPYKYYDNGTNKWYDNVQDIPTYVPTEPVTVVETQTPTIPQTEPDSGNTGGDIPVILPTEPFEALPPSYEPTDAPTDCPDDLLSGSAQLPTEGGTEPPGLPSAPNIPQETPTEYVLGDVNRDGKINIFDATAIQRFSALYIDYFSDSQLELADTNFDGKVNIMDATEIMRYVAGYITKFEKK